MFRKIIFVFLSLKIKQNCCIVKKKWMSKNKRFTQRNFYFQSIPSLFAILSVTTSKFDAFLINPFVISVFDTFECEVFSSESKKCFPQLLRIKSDLLIAPN